MLFGAYNVPGFEVQLKRMTEYTQNSEVKRLMEKIEIVKGELKNSSNLIEKRGSKFIRRRNDCIVSFVIVYVLLYLYYSRGTFFNKGR